jgi:endogenous inhibitor of DNA gyrase (YacG/DUF329 family)
MLDFVRVTNYTEAQMSERRPRFIRCASCNKKVTVAEAGRIPVYCSNACRQLAFARNTRGTKVSAEDRQRLSMWELLQDAGVVPADTPPPPKRKPEVEQ